MAAVTGGIERADEAEGLDPLECGPSFHGLNGLGILSSPRDLSATHAALTRTHWARSAAEWYLSKCKFRHEWDGSTLLIKLTESPDSVRKGRTDFPVVPQNIVPWARGGSAVHKMKVWSEGNGKMDCPVFDLPAGGAAIGGSCPGANAGQTVTDPATRARAAQRLAQMGVQLQPEKAICQMCYAESGSYAYSDNAARLVIRMWWSQAMVTGHYDEFVKVLAESALQLRYPEGAPHGILPIRLHSSGDFYSIPYAEAWAEVADRLYLDGGERGKRIVFWAPTRTWASDESWVRFWAERLPKMRSKNFMVRSSAYHFDEASPGKLAPGNAKGTTSVFITDVEAAKRRTDFHTRDGDKRFDWTCPTYSQLSKTDRAASLKNCTSSPNPMGGKHCRACWVAPELSVNYPAH